MLYSTNFFLAEPPLFRTTSMIQSIAIASEYPREIQESLLLHLDTPNLDSLNLLFTADRFTRGWIGNLRQFCSIRIFPVKCK